ncbi:MAG: hypothetical protein MUP58_03660 [Candidatus Nanohaloarchaeota archaeon QJJ-9]|nr:hypothetical protein [Candidatus Nanohaloarchaeota archaeon QJJ-9]
MDFDKTKVDPQTAEKVEKYAKTPSEMGGTVSETTKTYGSEEFNPEEYVETSEKMQEYRQEAEEVFPEVDKEDWEAFRAMFMEWEDANRPGMEDLKEVFQDSYDTDPMYK